MPKLEKCDRCLFYAYSPHLICAVHPGGVDSDCLDFRDNGKEEDRLKTLETDPFLIVEDCIDFRAYGLVEEPWSPEGYVWHGDNLIENRSPLTTEQRLEILNTHPILTAKCPNCGYELVNFCKDMRSAFTLEYIMKKIMTLNLVLNSWLENSVNAFLLLLIKFHRKKLLK